MTPARYRNLQEVLATVNEPAQAGRLAVGDRFVAVAASAASSTAYATGDTVADAIDLLLAAGHRAQFVVNLDTGFAVDVKYTLTYTESPRTFSFTDPRTLAG